MGFATDDLAGLLVPPDREFAGFAQGVIRTWNGDTFENSVEVRGGVLPNLPVASGVEALTYQAGDVVMLVRWKPGSGRGSASYWIGMGGRVIFPGEGAAQAQVAFLQTELADQISAEVFAARLSSASIPLSGGTVSNPGSDYIAADGPELTNVEVSETGECLLLLTARIACQINQPNGVSAAGWMSFRVTGATTVEPADDESLNNEVFGPAAEVVASTVQASRLVRIQGLNAGLHTIAARYRSQGIDPPPDTSVLFSSRNLTSIAL